MCLECCFKTMGLDKSDCSIMVAYAITASHVVFSHIILADLYKNWNGVPPDVYQKVTAIVFAIGINIEFFEILESWCESCNNTSAPENDPECDSDCDSDSKTENDS